MTDEQPPTVHPLGLVPQEAKPKKRASRAKAKPKPDLRTTTEKEADDNAASARGA